MSVWLLWGQIDSLEMVLLYEINLINQNISNLTLVSLSEITYLFVWVSFLCLLFVRCLVGFLFLFRFCLVLSFFSTL